MKKNLVSIMACLLALVLCMGCVLAEATMSDIATASDLATATDAATGSDLATTTDVATESDLTGEVYTDDCGDWYYIVNADGWSATVTAFRGNAEKVTVPVRVNGLRVVALAERAFAGNTTMTGVSIPYGVTEIADEAFSGCSKLAAANIPSSVNTLGSGAFNGCASLTELFVPSSVVSLNTTAFSGCDNLDLRCFKGYAPAKQLSAEDVSFSGFLHLVVDNFTNGK